MRTIGARIALLAMIHLSSVPALAYAEDGKGEVMLISAVEQGDIAQVRSLIAATTDLEVRDSSARTPLLVAVRANHVGIAAELIAAGADVNAKDEINDTPFLYAGAEGRNEILKLIIATDKADMEDMNRYGGTALIPAAHHGHPDTVRILLGTGIDIDHVNNLGWTALLEAVILGDGGPIYQEIVSLLVDAGAANIGDNDGQTPLDHARQRGFQDIVSHIEGGLKK